MSEVCNEKKKWVHGLTQRLAGVDETPASILRKSTSGRHRPVSYPDVNGYRWRPDIDLRRMLTGTVSLASQPMFSSWKLQLLNVSISIFCIYICMYVCAAGLGGWVGCAVRLETRRSPVRPPPRSATFFRGDWSWNIFYGHYLPSADSRRAGVSFWRKNVHNTG